MLDLRTKDKPPLSITQSDGTISIFDPAQMKTRRLALGMSQEDVAKVAYCVDSVYAAWEDGKEAPSAWWLSRLALALKCPPEDLMEGD